MKRLMVVLVAALAAGGCATRGQEIALGAGLLGGAVGYGVGRASAPAPMYGQPGYYAPPARTIHVEGARHLPNGKCVQSNGRVGVDRNGMCYVQD